MLAHKKKEKKFKERKVTNILCPVLWCTNLSQKVNIMMPTDKIFNSFHAHKLQGKSFSCHVEICCCHFFSGTSIICHAIKSLKQTMYISSCVLKFLVMMMSHFLEYWKLRDFLLLKMKVFWYLQKFPPWNGEIYRTTTGGGVQRNFSPIAKLQDTLFEKSNFCPKIPFWQNSNIFTSFSPNFFYERL